MSEALSAGGLWSHWLQVPAWQQSQGRVQGPAEERDPVQVEDGVEEEEILATQEAPQYQDRSCGELWVEEEASFWEEPLVLLLFHEESELRSLTYAGESMV